MYILVEFTDDKEIAIIPNNWLDGNQCALWPATIRNAGKIHNMVLKKTPSEEHWPSYPIKELYSNESYEAVRRKLKRAEVETDVASTATSDLEEDEDIRRSKRRKRAIVYSSDEEIVDSLLLKRLPTAPKVTPVAKNFGQKEHSETPFTQTPPSNVASLVRRSAVEETILMNGHRIQLVRDLKLFTEIEKVRQENKTILSTVEKILNVVSSLTPHGGNSLSDMSTPPENTGFPMSSMDEVEKLEEQLLDKAFFISLVNYLSVFGGRTRADNSRRIMQHCLKNELAIQYNWYGHKGKMCFSRLKLAEVVQKAVLRTFKATMKEVEIDIREWFRTASDRDGGRKKREEKRNRRIQSEISQNQRSPTLTDSV